MKRTSARVWALDGRLAVTATVVAGVSLARSCARCPRVIARDGCTEVRAVVVRAALEIAAFLFVVAPGVYADLSATGGKEAHGCMRTCRELEGGKTKRGGGNC